MRQAFACGITLLSFALGVGVAYAVYSPITPLVKKINMTQQLVSNGSPANTSLRGVLVSISTSSAVMSVPDPYTDTPIKLAFKLADGTGANDFDTGEQVYAYIERVPGSRLTAHTIYPVAVP